MAEVSAIVNARPLVAVSSDPDVPFILSPNQLLTQKLPNSFEATDLGTFSFKDMLKSEWKRAQGLADQFWKRWRTQYLQTLQSKRKLQNV